MLEAYVLLVFRLELFLEGYVFIELTPLLLTVPERLFIRDVPAGWARLFPTDERIDLPDEYPFVTDRIFDRERAFDAAELFMLILLEAGRPIGCLDDRETLPSLDIPD